MKRLVLVLNGKGGVGKSFFAVNLVQYLVDRKVAHTAIDTDNENSTLKRFHPAAEFVDLSHPRELDRIFVRMETTELAVVDCRAASSDLFLDHFAETGWKEVLEAADTRLTLAIPINHEADSVDQVQRFAESLGALPQYLIVRNAVHSDSFALYESLALRVRLTKELGAQEIEVPRLQDWLVETLNRENLTVTAAVTHASVHLLDRQRLRHWQRRLYAALATVQQLLLPEVPHGK